MRDSQTIETGQDKGLNSFRQVLNVAISIVAVSMFSYHMLFAQMIWQTSFEHQATHLGFALVLLFLTRLHGSRGWAIPWLTLLLLISIVSSVYIIVRSEHIEDLLGFAPPLDFAIGIMLLVAVIVATYQWWGVIIPSLAVLFLVYMFWGHNIPGYMRHLYIPADQIVSFIALSTQGAFGAYLMASADYIFLFVIFGSLLGTFGANRFFIQVGRMVARRVAGGSGQTATISSGLVGMVTGIVMANVAITGAFTIPAMKAEGYTPEQAGAIEAVASTGGQIMPPVMGLGAFIMVVLTGIPYLDICAAALIPALLFYFLVFLGVRILASKSYISASSNNAVNWKEVLSTAHLFILPVALLIYLLVRRYSVMYVGFYIVIAVIVLGMIRRESRPALREFVESITNGAVIGSSVAVICGTIGVITQGMTLTGLGGKISGLIIAGSMDYLPLALIMIALIGLFLGCGMPTPAAYALVASLGAPLLVKMGVTIMAAHLFALYYAVLSAITPPVATGCLVGARLSGGRFWKTSIEAVKLSYPLYVVPFLWVNNEVLLGKFTDPTTTALTLLSVILGFLSALPALQGYAFGPVKTWERFFFVACTILLFAYVLTLQLIFSFLGFGLFALLAVREWMKFKLHRGS